MAARSTRAAGPRVPPPPRDARGLPAPDPERVGRALFHAEAVGDQRAAERAGVSYRAIEEWRRKYSADPAVQVVMERLRAQVAGALVGEIADGIRVTIGRGLAILQSAKGPRDLGKVSAFLKVLVDAGIALKVLPLVTVEVSAPNTPTPTPPDAVSPVDCGGGGAGGAEGAGAGQGDPAPA